MRVVTARVFCVLTGSHCIMYIPWCGTNHILIYERCEINLEVIFKVRNTYTKSCILFQFKLRPLKVVTFKCQIRVTELFDRLYCNELRVIWPVPHEILSVITRSTIIT